MITILTIEQLRLLTGYQYGKKQAEWLERELGLRVPVGKDGYPRVSQHVIDQATLARRAAAQSADPTNITHLGATGPKWSRAA